MRKIGFGAAGLAGAMLLSTSAFAQTPPLNDKLKQIAPGNNDAVPKLALGEDVAISCEAIERVADHATNIAEEVFYLYQGQDIRHEPSLKQGVKQDGPQAP